MSDPKKELKERSAEVKQLLKNYSSKIKRGVPVLMSRKDVSFIGKFLIDSKEAGGNMAGYKQYYKNIMDGNFSNIEDAPAEFIAFMASAKYYQEAGRKTVEFLLDDEKKGTKEHLDLVDKFIFDPLMRRGLELASNTTALPENERRDAENLCFSFNETVMNRTLTPPGKEELSRIKEEVDGNDIELKKALAGNEKQQLLIAKTLFLTQLGGAYLLQKNGKNMPFEGSCAELFVHGGRTIIQLPKGKSKQSGKLQEDYLYDIARGHNKGCCVETRFSATHSADVKKSGDINETSDTSILTGYGCNPAIGGIGRLCNGKMIRNDGTDGHVFVKAEPGDEKKTGYIMIGFESESTFSTGKTGHFHGPSATSAQFSPFMAGKNGLSAASKGGRIVDLSGMDTQALDKILLAFNDRWEDMHHGSLSFSAEDIEGMVSKLSGPMMNADQMEHFLGVYNIAPGLDVEQLRSGAKERFKKLNSDADEKTRKKAVKLGLEEKKPKAEKSAPDLWKTDPRDVKYELSPGVQNIMNKLEKDKHKILGVKVDDSPEMKKVKLILEMINNRRIDGSLNLENALELFVKLDEAASAYIRNPDKSNNVRMKNVKAAREFADDELLRIRTQRKELRKEFRPPENTNSEKLT